MSDADVSSTNGVAVEKKEEQVEDSVTTSASAITSPVKAAPPVSDEVVSSTPEGETAPVNSISNGTNGTNGHSENGVAEEKELIKKAEEALAQGNRYLLIEDLAAAVTSLAEACELYTEIYGELADELGDVYLAYGKALLANARQHSSVLGDRMQKGDEEDSDDEDTEDSPEAEGAEKPSENDVSTTNKTEKEEAKEEVKEVTEAKESEAEASQEAEKSEKKTEDAVAGPSDGGSAEPESTNDEQEKDEDEEEGDDLQLSWQILEMAKVIFQRKQADAEIAVKLSEVYLTLGEVGVESERCDTAVVDMKSALEIQEKHLKPDDRLMAHTLYQLGMAFAVSENYDDAVTHYKLSIDQLERRLKTLEQAKADDAESTEAADKEAKEINDIIADIREKISDTEESKKVVKAKLAEQLGFTALAEATGASTSGASASSPVKPANDISHLVKKRKIEENEDVNSKKPKTDG